MKQYLDFLQHILDNGNQREDRTGTGTIGIFGYQMRFDLSQGFPLITTKKCHMRSIIHELLWFLSGDTNISYLQQNGVSIWDEWATDEGDLGPVYGKQWRSWQAHDKSIDQIARVVEEIKNNPCSRRLVVSAWNPSVLPDASKSPKDNALAGRQALPPCHCLFQFYVEQGFLSCQLYQRSADAFLGVPFNIASYSLLCMMMAQVCNLECGEFILSFGDTHIYLNHRQQVQQQLSRKPYPLPTMQLNSKIDNIFDFTFEDFTLCDYQAHSRISAPIAV